MSIAGLALVMALLAGDGDWYFTDPKTGQPCTPGESSRYSVWSRAEQTSHRGSVSFEFNRCPGVSSIRVLQDGEMIFRAESSDAPHVGRVAFDAGRSPILPEGFEQNYPDGPVRLAAGPTYALIFGGGDLATDFTANLFTLAPPPDTTYLERDDGGMRIRVRPGSYTAVELRGAHGSLVWRHEFSAPIREISLRLVRGDNIPATMQAEIVATAPSKVLSFEPFELSPRLWYELHAIGADDHFATFFQMP